MDLISIQLIAIGRLCIDCYKSPDIGQKNLCRNNLFARLQEYFDRTQEGYDLEELSTEEFLRVDDFTREMSVLCFNCAGDQAVIHENIAVRVIKMQEALSREKKRKIPKKSRKSKKGNLIRFDFEQKNK